MAIILNSTFSIIREPQTGAITDIRWLTKSLCSLEVAQRAQPEHVVYLLESFGAGAPQSLSFELAGEEFSLYMNTPDDVATEVYNYLMHAKQITIASAVHNPSDINQFETVSWTAPITVYKNYMTMVTVMAELTSRVAQWA
jgi:hypothetical protein